MTCLKPPCHLPPFYPTSPYVIYPYLGKETFKTLLTITFVISLHKAISAKRITTVFTNETICMVRLILIIQLFFFRLNLTTTMSTSGCRTSTTLVKKNVRYNESNYNLTCFASVDCMVEYCTSTVIRKWEGGSILLFSL